MRYMIMGMLLWVISNTAIANDDMRLVAQRVLSNLYKTNGNFIYMKPKLKIVDDNANAALYLRRANTIELSTKVYEVCRSFEKDSLSALAFIIGHELAHAYQTELSSSSTSFLAYDKHHDHGKHLEEAADVQGIFMAYLAGYNTLNMVETLIPEIYQAFNLTGELKGYPTLDDRKASGLRAIEIAREMTQLFEAANYLLVIGKFELALKCFDYIKLWYNGSEIYNNIGICKVKLAMNMQDKNRYPFVYPFELDWNTRMDKPRISRGDPDLSVKEQILFEELILSAIESFETVSKMQPMELDSEINKLSAMLLINKEEEALQLIENQDLELRALFSKGINNPAGKLETIKALLDIKNGKLLEAEERLAKLQKLNGILGKQAKHNLTMLKENECIDETDQLCEGIQINTNKVDGVRLHRNEGIEQWTDLDTTAQIKYNIDIRSNSIIFSFMDDEGYFRLQQISDTSVINLNENFRSTEDLMTDAGALSTCDSQNIVLRFGKKGELNEWVKYY